jgi:hypothetical protein
MLDIDQISQIVTRVVEANTAPRSVRRVMAEPVSTSEGEDALRITVVLTPEAVNQLASGHPLDVLVQTSDQLRSAGDQRFPILKYATEEELEDVGNPGS